MKVPPFKASMRSFSTQNDPMPERIADKLRNEIRGSNRGGASLSVEALRNNVDSLRRAEHSNIGQVEPTHSEQFMDNLSTTRDQLLAKAPEDLNVKELKKMRGELIALHNEVTGSNGYENAAPLKQVAEVLRTATDRLDTMIAGDMPRSQGVEIEQVIDTQAASSHLANIKTTANSAQQIELTLDQDVRVELLNDIQTKLASPPAGASQQTVNLAANYASGNAQVIASIENSLNSGRTYTQAQAPWIGGIQGGINDVQGMIDGGSFNATERAYWTEIVTLGQNWIDSEGGNTTAPSQALNDDLEALDTLVSGIQTPDADNISDVAAQIDSVVAVIDSDADLITPFKATKTSLLASKAALQNATKEVENVVEGAEMTMEEAMQQFSDDLLLAHRLTARHSVSVSI